MTSPALIESLRRVWAVLDRAKIPAALVGGLAMAVWNHARATRDIDVLILADERTLSELVRALAASGIRRLDSRSIPLGATELLQFVAATDNSIDIKVDLLVARSDFIASALARRITIGEEALGFALQTLTCEDLILLKLLAGRIIDLADAAALARANWHILDRDYLVRTGELLEIASSVSESLREASQ